MITSTLAAATTLNAVIALAPPPYKATVLPQLDEHPGKNSLIFTWGYAINDHRVVVGSIGGTYEAFAWAPGRKPLFFQPPFADESSPTSINNTGHIVGVYLPTGVFSNRPFSYTPDGVFTTLPGWKEGLGAYASDINESGMIVGGAETAPGGPFGGPTTAVFWRDGVLHEIGNLGGFTAGASAVNNHNVVVGYANTASAQAAQPYRWTEAEGIEVLPQLVEGMPALPADINDHGIIVGRAGLSLFWNEPVYWTPDGEIHQLPRLYSTPDTGVAAVNNDGVMVGHEAGLDGPPEARIWIEGEAYRLEDYVFALDDEFHLLECTDVNENGVITALASKMVNNQIQHFTVMLMPLRIARPSK